jgi:hypothetical protein
MGAAPVRSVGQLKRSVAAVANERDRPGPPFAGSTLAMLRRLIFNPARFLPPQQLLRILASV